MTDDDPDMLESDWLHRSAATNPEAPALVTGGVEQTYAEVDSAVQAASRELLDAGVGAGDTVVLEQHPGADFVFLFHALRRIGAAAMPLNPRLGEAERARAMAEARPRLLITADGQRVALSPAVETDAGATHDITARPLARILTSGTSGAGTLVDLSPANFHASALGSAQVLGPEANRRWLCCMPLFHVGGLSILTRSAIYGAAADVHDGFDTDRVAATLAEGGVTGVSLVTTQLRRLIDADADLTSPQAIVLGGGPLPRDLLEEALGRGASVLQTYGLTEACSQVSILAPGEQDAHRGSSGRAIPGTALRIDEGEICVQGGTVARGSLAEDGWLHTGDVGHLDEEGFLYVTDRLGDMIVSGGENVLPGEIEEALREHPDVDDVAVVGREDPEWGEAVTAVIVPAAGAAPDPEVLRAHSAARLAPHQVPKVFEFTKELPRTASGKLRRRELR